MMTLEQKHIDHLYEFVRRHFVPHYDLQTELVDHLASGIEQLSEQYPEKTFEQLLELEFKKFGVHGFEDVVEKRRNALSKEYFRMVLRRLINYFQWPVILQSVFFMVLLFLVFTYPPHESIVVIVFTGLATFMLYSIVRLLVKRGRYEYDRDRKWLLQDVIFQMGGGGVFLYIPMQILSYVIDDPIQDLIPLWARIALAVGAVVYFRLVQVMCWAIPSQIDSILEERYKTYKFSD